MPDEDALERRLEAVERTLADGDHDVEALREAADVRERVERLESTVEDLREEVDDLDAAAQALRGYVGNVRSVNRDVERRADAALAAVDRLESDDDATTPSSAEPSSAEQSNAEPPTGATGQRDDSPAPDDPPGPASPTDPDTRPTGGPDRDAATPTACAGASDLAGRQRGCPYCSDRPTADPGPARDGDARSSASETADGRESTDGREAGVGRDPTGGFGTTDGTGTTGGTGATDGTGATGEPGTRPPASPPRRDGPTETPATTRTTADRGERGTLDRIRDLLA